MTPFLLYQLKVAVCLGLFTALYYLLFRKETFYIANRIYLTGTMILSVCIPVMRLPVMSGSYQEPVIATINPVVITAFATKAAPDYQAVSWLQAVYISIAILFALYFLYHFMLLIRLIRRHSSMLIDRCKVFIVPGQKQSFAFFHFIFVSSAEKDSQILNHEMVHSRQFHSIDLLLVQLLKIFQWFNPFVYFLEKALQETHEYLADEAAMEHDGQSYRYRMLLVTQAFGIQPGIFNFFNYSIIKNRLIMITKERSRRRLYLKYLSVLPIMLTAFIFLTTPVISQTSGKNSNTGAAEKKTTENPPPPAYQPEMVKVEKQVVTQQPDDEPAFVFVEQLAQFQGGSLEKFREWVQQNLVYPPAAVENGIFGRITMQFAVNSKGKVCDIKVLRGVDPILDNEAIRVISSSPEWTPARQGGKAVKQQFVFPVIFSLMENKTGFTDPKRTMLKFQGAEGDAAMMKFREWVQTHVVYPPEAKANGIQGEIRLMFTVNPSGKMSDVKIYQGVHPLLDEEVLKVVKSAPDWEPFPKGEDKPALNLMSFVFKI